MSMTSNHTLFDSSTQEDGLKKTFTLPGNKKVRVLKSEQLVCLDETHLHRSPVQKMIALDVNGHLVEVTEDGDRFNVRVDESLTRCDLTVEQAVDFVKVNTS